MLAVILILGIITLIAISTVNKVLQVPRVGDWQSIGNQMTKSAENHFQLRGMRYEPYIMEFIYGSTSSGWLEFDASGNITS